MHLPPLARSNVTSLWAAVMAETFARMGVTQAVTCPGDRAVPITVALENQPTIETIVVIDERSAAFVALGLAKSTGKPVLLVCTAGTAAANFYPAINEAALSRIPLIVLTTDRPPELQRTGSEQTMPQEHLYGHAVHFFRDLPTPEPNLNLFKALRQACAATIHAAMGVAVRPVHLNIPLRYPLAPTPQPTPQLDALLPHVDTPEFFAHLTPPLNIRPTADCEALLSAWERIERGLIAAGPYTDTTLNRIDYIKAVGKLAAHLGWPVLADALSPLRHATDAVPNVIATYGSILEDAQLAEALRPDCVISLGRLPTNKKLRGWLMDTCPLTYLIEPSNQNEDPLHRPTQIVGVGVEVIAAQIRDPKKRSTAYTDEWMALEAHRESLIAKKTNASADDFESAIAWALEQSLPSGTPIFIGTSLPIRHAEGFWKKSDRRFDPYVNRGVNGIDGLVSTAIGVTLGLRKPAVALIGDLSMLHDINSLLSGKYLKKTSLTVILINNAGGRLFERLPIADFQPIAHTHVITPQSVDFEKIVQGYHTHYKRFESWRAIQAAAGELPASGLHIWEWDLSEAPRPIISKHDYQGMP